jgi:predicted RNA-binding protein with PUA-like domain
MAKQYWLMKSEPDTFSIDSLQKMKRVPWDGIRNYRARNILRDEMKRGDEAFFYHSSCPEPGIVGIMEIVKEASPDPLQFDSKSPYFDPKASPSKAPWVCVEVAFKRKAKSILPLSFIKADSLLKKMALIRWNRLSVTPVSAEEWKYILAMKGLW